MWGITFNKSNRKAIKIPPYKPMDADERKKIYGNEEQFYGIFGITSVFGMGIKALVNMERLYGTVYSMYASDGDNYDADHLTFHIAMTTNEIRKRVPHCTDEMEFMALTITHELIMMLKTSAEVGDFFSKGTWQAQYDKTSQDIIVLYNGEVLFNSDVAEQTEIPSFTKMKAVWAAQTKAPASDDDAPF